MEGRGGGRGRGRRNNIFGSTKAFTMYCFAFRIIGVQERGAAAAEAG